jgi:periplasmic protein CpxP/Spy
MNRVRLVLIGTMLIAAVAMLAQQTSANSPSKDVGNLPSVDAQMKVLTEKLDLTAGQQSKIRPIMLELHDYTVKLMQDESLSQQERLDKVRPRRIEAGEKIRQFLTEDQKAKFNACLQGPHKEMHGDLSGKGVQK